MVYVRKIEVKVVDINGHLFFGYFCFFILLEQCNPLFDSKVFCIIDPDRIKIKRRGTVYWMCTNRVLPMVPDSIPGLTLIQLWPELCFIDFLH